ncbi:MAG: hypothetical protein ACP5VR_10495 [Acidimicrobiales bacterium]
MTEAGIAQMVAVGDRDGLERLRAELVERLYLRPDDHEATAALREVNRALAKSGWRFDFDWRHRRKP